MEETMEETLEETLIRLARLIDEKRYGKYPGIVTDNKDPQKRGRLKLLVHSVLADQDTDWALPCLPYGGAAQQGMFMVPEVDAPVWVEFEEGDIHRPIWVGLANKIENDSWIIWKYKDKSGELVKNS